jgi:ParB-like chromosome segregation protein Spo0J
MAKISFIPTKVILPLSDLVCPDYNPKENIRDDPETYASLYKTINENGYLDEIVINNKSGENIIVSGNQRYAILVDMVNNLQIDPKEAEVEVILMKPVDQDTEMAVNIGFNRIKTNWMAQKLKEDLEHLQSLDNDIIKFTGFSDEEINKMISNPAAGDDEISEQLGNRDFQLRIKLPSEAQQLYDFYIAAYGEEKLKDEIMHILG